jgi:hypothetical protein
MGLVVDCGGLRTANSTISTAAVIAATVMNGRRSDVDDR